VIIFVKTMLHVEEELPLKQGLKQILAANYDVTLLG